MAKSETKEKFNTDFLMAESSFCFTIQIQRAGFLPEKMQILCLLCKGEMFLKHAGLLTNCLAPLQM